MNPSRHAPLEHPLVPLFERAIDSLSVSGACSPQSVRQYRGTARHFLIYLGEEYPELRSLDQLRRDPHLLGWLTHLRSHTPPFAAVTYINRILFLRVLLRELAVLANLPELAFLFRREDLPRRPQRLPRALTAEQDQLIQQELLHRNDLAANVFLLIRHTGMRIGEAADLPYDCLHSPRPGQWAIHVPLGKLKTERMVPVDSFVRELVQRIRFFRCFDPLPDNGLLLARPCSKATLTRHLRCYLHEVTAAVGISTRIVPHQLRHTYASEMLRAGVSFPVLMKLLGHKDAEMTMQYLDIALTDLEREFQLARSQPRHLTPQPKAHLASLRGGLDGVVDSLLAAQHLMEMFRRALPDDHSRRCLDRLSNRLIKIRSLLRKLNIQEK
jgi:integrase